VERGVLDVVRLGVADRVCVAVGVAGGAVVRVAVGVCVGVLVGVTAVDVVLGVTSDRDTDEVAPFCPADVHAARHSEATARPSGTAAGPRITGRSADPSSTAGS
jgi:hypothetical protein